MPIPPLWLGSLIHTVPPGEDISLTLTPDTEDCGLPILWPLVFDPCSTGGSARSLRFASNSRQVKAVAEGEYPKYASSFIVPNF
jgi:hypothetical protein